MDSNNHMFNRKRQYGSDYPKQNQSFQKNSRPETRSFSYLYYDGPGASNDRTSTPNKKRPKMNPWDTPFRANQANQNSSYMGRRMSSPKPLMSIKAPPNQMANRKYFTQKPSNSMAVPNTRPKKKPTVPTNESVDTYILRADQMPNNVLTSRLEAGMGALLKEIKENCTDIQNSMLLKSIHMQKTVKQSIRERLKTAMLNKFVGKVVDIVESYREMFSLKNDMEMLAKILAKTDLERNQLSQDFDSKLEKNLNVMFEKVSQIWRTNSMDVLDVVEAQERAENGEKNTEGIKYFSKIRTDFYQLVVDSLIMKRLPLLLPKYRDIMLKILEEEPVIDHNESVIAIEPDKPKTIDIHDSDSEIETVVEVNTDALIGEKENDKELIEDEQLKESIDQTNGDEKTSLDNANNIPKDIAADVINLPDSQTAEDKTGNIKLEKQTKEIDTQASSLFLVKVLSQPNLPSKADTYKFLNKFNPISVKKHKVIQNLLVVSFKEENDFNEVLAASGTIIGKSKLIIRGNKVQQPLAPTPVTNIETTVNDSDISKNESSSDNILGSDLENQITDLLSSIRKGDEQQKDTSSSDGSQVEQEKEVIVAQEVNKDDKQEEEVTNLEPEDISSDKILDEQQADIVSCEDNIIEQSNIETDNTTKELEKVDEMDTNRYSPNNPSEDSKVTALVEEVRENDGEDTTEPEVVTETGSETAQSNQDVKMTPKRSTRLAAATPSSIRTRRASMLSKQ